MIESPCVNICQIHPVTGLCLGCHRTRDEIRAWRDLDDAAKLALLADLPGRSAAPKHRRGGREARLRTQGS